MGANLSRAGGRRRRNKTDANGMPVAPRTIHVGDIDWDEAASSGNLVPAPEPNEEWHEIARHFWEGLTQSPQRLYYEMSDWAFAYLLCEQISRELNPKFVGTKKIQDGETSSGLPIMIDEEMFEVVPMSGGSVSSIIKAMEKLMVTEIDRRKARIEIERNAIIEDDVQEDVVSDRMRLLQGGKTG